MGASWDIMMFTSSVALSNLTVLPCFFVSGVGLFFVMWPLCGVLGRVFLEYFALFLRVTGAMQQAFFTLVVRLLVWPAFFVLCFPLSPFSGLVGEADSLPFCFLA